MTQREEIQTLKDEVAEFRKQLSAIAVSMAQLAASQPVQYVPYVPFTPALPIQWGPTTYTSPNACQSITVPGEVTSYN